MWFLELLKLLVLPPTVLVLAILLGCALRQRWRRFGTSLTWGAATLLYLLAMPLVATRLLAALQTAPVLDPAAAMSRGRGPGPGRTLDLEILRSATADRLPSAWRPRRLVLVPSIPLLATGKPDRAALRDLAARDSSPTPVPTSDPRVAPPAPQAPPAAQEH